MSKLIIRFLAQDFISNFRMFGNFSMDAIAALGFGIDLDLYKNENNEFAIRAQAIFNAFKGLGVFLNRRFPYSK